VVFGGLCQPPERKNDGREMSHELREKQLPVQGEGKEQFFCPRCERAFGDEVFSGRYDGDIVRCDPCGCFSRIRYRIVVELEQMVIDEGRVLETWKETKK